MRHVSVGGKREMICRREESLLIVRNVRGPTACGKIADSENYKVCYRRKVSELDGKVKEEKENVNV